MNASPVLCAVLIAATSMLAAASRAEDEPAAQVTPGAQASSGIVPKPVVSMPAPGRPRGLAPAGQTAAAAPADSNAPASFVSEEKWGMAGYNNNEPIYTILITSHDPRIIRCTADLKGTYIENGEKLPITDRQTMTVFPNQQVQMGNWSGMDQQSGAVYSVKCRPL